jgi:hypothetical protein
MTSPLNISTNLPSNQQVQLSDQAVHILAQMILPDLMSAPTEAGPLVVSDLPVAAPSLRPSGWETAGQN